MSVKETIILSAYLQSDERAECFANHPEFTWDELDELQKEVHHADVENAKVWAEKNGLA